jgi:hypothetical protein
MKKSTCIVLLSFLCFFLLISQSYAYIEGTGFLCVNGGTSTDPPLTVPLNQDFQDALDAVTSTNHELRLIQGTYPIQNGSDGHFSIQRDHSLTISGGWNTDCSSQTQGPQLTVLQGGQYQNGLPGGVLSVSILDNSSPATVSISNLTFEEGRSELDGGGLYLEHNSTTGFPALATFNISNIVAQSNYTDGYGSGIGFFDWNNYASDGSNINITDSIVQDNIVLNTNNSDTSAGGIYIDQLSYSPVNATISRCQILNNSAMIEGGGLFINTGSGNAILVNNIIAGNTVIDDVGGGLYIGYIYTFDEGDITLTNNTITGNSSTGTLTDAENGGGIFAAFQNPASILDIFNNIVYGNTANVGDDLYILNDGVQVNLFNNDFNSATEGFYIEDTVNYSHGDNLNNIDPLFVDAINDDYHLTADSPVINLGSNTAPAVPSDDLDTNPRPVSCVVDMGAYEYQVAEECFNLDIDGNGVADALSDGVLIVRYLFGFRGAVLIDGAVDTVNGTRITAPEIEAYLAVGVSTLLLDIDGNGVADALSDGVLIVRYLFGFRGAVLIDGAVDTVNGTRTTAPEIEAYIQSIL